MKAHFYFNALYVPPVSRLPPTYPMYAVVTHIVEAIKTYLFSLMRMVMLMTL